MSGDVVVITGPSTASVSTADAKLHLRVAAGVTADDTYIDMLVKTAEIAVFNVTGWPVMSQVLEYRLDSFPCKQTLELNVANVTSVDSVKYDDTDDAEQTWSATNYWTDILSLPARLTKKNTVNWPTTISNKPACVRIRITAGTALAANIPAHIRHAIKLLVSEWYESREDSAEIALTNIPSGVRYLLDNPSYSFYRL